MMGGIRTLRALAIIIGMAILAYLLLRAQASQFKREAFSGIVDSVYWNKVAPVFIVDGYEHELTVAPVNGVPEIDKIAKKGDSIFKKRNSDTVILVHLNHQILKYTQTQSIYR